MTPSREDSEHSQLQHKVRSHLQQGRFSSQPPTTQPPPAERISDRSHLQQGGVPKDRGTSRRGGICRTATTPRSAQVLGSNVAFPLAKQRNESSLLGGNTASPSTRQRDVKPKRSPAGPMKTGVPTKGQRGLTATLGSTNGTPIKSLPFVKVKS